MPQDQDRRSEQPDVESGAAATAESSAPAEPADPTMAFAEDSADGHTEESTDQSLTPEKEWWDDPRMPWKGRPGRRDIACWIAFSLTGVYALVLLPLRPVLIGHLPLLLVGLSGSRSGLVTIGALAAVGRASWWWVGLIIGSLSLIKFDPIFFYAGRLWGRGLVDVFAGRSPRAARNADRAERLARKYGVVAIILSYVVPIPSPVIFATVGAAGMRIRTFIAVDLLSALAINSLWLYLGHRLGQRAVDVVDVIARYSTWLSLALITFIVVGAIWRARRKNASER